MTHSERYPEQYNHSWVGRKVQTKTGKIFTIERVVNSRFGQLACEPGDSKSAWALSTLTILKDEQ